MTDSATTPSDSLLNLEENGPIQMGFWVPNHVWATAKFLVPLRRELSKRRKDGTLTRMRPEIVEFKTWVTSNSVYRMWVNSMIAQANDVVRNLPESDRHDIVCDGDVLWIEGYDAFFELLNEIITTSPAFNCSAMVGTPMNGLLAVAMATEAGLALFHDASFNLAFRKVLNAWNSYLISDNSLDLLDIANPEKPGSWISREAHAQGVWTDMQHDPKLPGYGYDSWNSFFIREFVPGARPFHGAPAEVVNIGCETTPWQYANDLKLENEFWIKDVNYSLLDLFGGELEWAEPFVGGQLYQGFLSATHYHRWRAPLDGRIVRSWRQQGTYFAQNPCQREGQGTWKGTESQPYLGHLATRAIFVFEHPAFGYVAFICIGMVEVSTCFIEPNFVVNQGADPVRITRDTELGRFEFGGSTHVMLFQKDRADVAEWAINATRHRNDPDPTKMGTVIATARP